MATINSTRTMFPNLTSSENHMMFNSLILAGAISMIGVILLGNGIVILLFVLYRRIRNFKNCFVASLAVSDFFIGCLLPLSILQTLSHQWPFDGRFCDVYIVIRQSLYQASLANAITISVDRCWSISYPFSYRAKRNKRLALFVSLFTYLICFVVQSTMIFPYSSNGVDIRKTTHCDIVFVDNHSFVLPYVLFFYVIPITALVVINVFVFLKIRRRRAKKVRRSLSCRGSVTNMNGLQSITESDCQRYNDDMNVSTFHRRRTLGHHNHVVSNRNSAADMYLSNRIITRGNRSFVPRLTRHISFESMKTVACKTLGSNNRLGVDPMYPLMTQSTDAVLTSHNETRVLPSQNGNAINDSTYTSTVSLKSKLSKVFPKSGNKLNSSCTSMMNRTPPSDYLPTTHFLNVPKTSENKGPALTPATSHHASADPVNSTTNRNQTYHLIPSADTDPVNSTSNRKQTYHLIPSADTTLPPPPKNDAVMTRLSMLSLASKLSAVSQRQNSGELMIRDLLIKQDRKAAISLGTSVILCVVCWAPYLISLTLRAFGIAAFDSWFYSIAFWMVSFNSFVNPFIYAASNSSYKHITRTFWSSCVKQKPHMHT